MWISNLLSEAKAYTFVKLIVLQLNFVKQKVLNMEKLIIQMTEAELKAIVTEASEKAVSLALNKTKPKEEGEAGKVEAVFFTKKQAARHLNCCTSTIDNAARAGKLTRHYLGNTVRFRIEEVKKLATPKI